MPTINPYLDAAQTINFGRPDLARLEQLDGEGLRAYIFECVEARDRLVARYSWAIQNQAKVWFIVLRFIFYFID